MKPWVYFGNEEEIDLQAISVMGVSVKTADNPIGYFGTGLKFAIATLLRTGHEVRIYSGCVWQEFTRKPMEFRGEKFERVIMGDGVNEVELPFTTDLGKDWKPWQAYRELYSNALDESGTVGLEQDDAHGTVLAVRGDGILEAYEARNQIFIEREPKAVTPVVAFNEGESTSIFYRRVRACDLSVRTTFTYNIIGKTLELTEDRTLKYDFYWKGAIVEAVVEDLGDRDMIERILLAPQGYLEPLLDFDNGDTPSELFSSVVSSKLHDARLNKSAIALWKKNRPEQDQFEVVRGSDADEAVIAEALELLALVGAELKRDGFKLIKAMGQRWGLVRNGEILLSQLCIDKGPAFVASTLFEEHLHAHECIGDHTREFQDRVLDRLFYLAQQIHGVK